MTARSIAISLYPFVAQFIRKSIIPLFSLWRSFRKIEELLHCIEISYNQPFHMLSRSFAPELSHTRSDQEHHRVRFSLFIILDRFRITRDNFLNDRLELSLVNGIDAPGSYDVLDQLGRN